MVCPSTRYGRRGLRAATSRLRFRVTDLHDNPCIQAPHVLVSFLSDNQIEGDVMHGLFKGVVLGAVTSTLVLTAATAFAGSGIGGVFNPGQTNTVNETTTLTGAKTAGAQLHIENTR